MSLIFNDTTNYKGIVQLFEKEVGLNRGDISGNVDKLKDLTADVNLALDEYMAIAIQASGNWQFDDTNHTTYPIITTNIVSGQQAYSVLTDQEGSLVLDIYKVIAYDSLGNGRELEPVDVTADDKNQDFFKISPFYSGETRSGVPTRYAKTANGIFLDFVPDYNATNGLKLYINRESTYFTYTDTTKSPGVPGLHQRYFVIKPAYWYAARNSMAIAGGRLRNGSFTGLLMNVKDYEDAIRLYFGQRERDIKRQMTPVYVNTR